MRAPEESFRKATAGLTLGANVVPWDTAAFGFPVAQIGALEVRDAAAASEDFQDFVAWRKERCARIVSCRLPHDRLRESFFLEAQGFRFIEMVLHPKIEQLQEHTFAEDTLVIEPAEAADLPCLCAIAREAFVAERFQVDPRLGPEMGGLRYSRWVRNSLRHPTQRLMKIREGAEIVALFIVGRVAPDTAYWHLTAISPKWQGRGYGQRVWIAMLRQNKLEGFERVSTTISARNVAVLNLYSKLNFRFLPPEMTFHWVDPAGCPRVTPGECAAERAD